MGVRNLFPSFFYLRKLSSLFKMKNNNQMKGGSLGMISNTLQMGPPGWAGWAAWSRHITDAQLFEASSVMSLGSVTQFLDCYLCFLLCIKSLKFIVYADSNIL